MFARRNSSIFASTMVLLIAACAGESAECPSGYCGKAVGMLYAEPGTLFPPIVQGADAQTVSNLIFFPLADIGDELNTKDPSTFVPRLARSWEFEDSLTLVFEMDPRATWHDGTPVTAHDVSFTFSVYMDTLLSVPARSSMESIDRVSARDDSTAVFEFNRWHTEQFYAATYQMQILPRHLLDSIPRDRLSAHSFTTNPIGSGPYRFVQWNPGQSIALTADTTFFLGRPGLPRIEWRFSNDANTIMTPLVSEDADILSTIVSPENVALAQRTAHLSTIRYPGGYYGYLAFNYVDQNNRTRPHPLFSDPDVRRAIAMAVDRGLVARTAHGDSATPPSQPATRLVGIYQEEVPVLEFDPAGARAILERAGWTDSDGDDVLDRDGRDLSFELLAPTSSNARLQSAAVITSLLAEVGIEVTQAQFDFGVFSERMINGDFDAYLGSWFVQPSAAGIRGTWTSSGIGSQNFGQYSNAVVDSLVQLAMAERDPEREDRLWGEAFAAMNRDPGALWIYAPPNYAAIHRRFEGVSLRPDRWNATMWQWHVRDGEWLPRDIDPS